MKKKTNKLTMISMIVCSILCVALLVTQFLPWWTTEVKIDNDAGEKVVEQKDFSVWGFLSFPENPAQKQVASYFTKTVGDNYTINGLAGTACFIIAFTVLTLFFTIFKPGSPWGFVWPLVCGIAGLWGYLTQLVLQLNSLWILSLILSALIVAICLFPAIQFLYGIKRWFVEEDDE